MRSTIVVTDVRNVLGSNLVRNVVAGCRDMRSKLLRASKSFGKRFAFMADHLRTSLRHLWRTTRYQGPWQMQPATLQLAIASAAGERITVASCTPAAAARLR